MPVLLYIYGIGAIEYSLGHSRRVCLFLPPVDYNGGNRGIIDRISHYVDYCCKYYRCGTTFDMYEHIHIIRIQTENRNRNRVDSVTPTRKQDETETTSRSESKKGRKRRQMNKRKHTQGEYQICRLEISALGGVYS